MISLSRDFDLGRDETRIKDQRDALRQSRTTQELLTRFFHAEDEQRWEIQLLADEVGMGKTFVALATAYSILSHMRDARLRGNPLHPDLSGTRERVLVIAPENRALARKWNREIKEFIRRCMPEDVERDARQWFHPETSAGQEPIDRLDDLAGHLRSPDTPGVLVTHMGVFAKGQRLRDLDLKRRILLGCLFRFWGNRFGHEARRRLLKGAPEGWPAQAEDLCAVSDEDWKKLPFDSPKQLLDSVHALATDEEAAEELERLLELCREIAQPYVRGRDELFKGVADALARLYRQVCFAQVKDALPLVIVDEAHNWKNGPKQGSNGYHGFVRYVAPLTRRLLLLTATPFQLRPAEMLELLDAGRYIRPSPDPVRSTGRCERLVRHRDTVIRPVLEQAARQSRTVARAWGRTPASLTTVLAEAWSSDILTGLRRELGALAHQAGALESSVVARKVEEALSHFPPDARDMLRAALMLYAYNEDLSQELGALVIRHRRSTDHRLVKVGMEYAGDEAQVRARSDRHVLHASPGLDVRGAGELPHYLLMRCVSEMKGGKGRSSLGSALTGCYSTLLASAEGQSVSNKLAQSPTARGYLDLLRRIVDESRDPEHPKVAAFVDAAIAAWRAGEKTLVFCFRTHTAARLCQIIAERINAEIDARSNSVIGSAEALKNLKNRITGRRGDLIGLGLDRLLWSLRWAARSEVASLPALADIDFRLTNDELREVARLALSYGVDLRGNDLDRVFLHRATEHVLARRLQTLRLPRVGPLPLILAEMSSEAWVRAPYGVQDDPTQIEPGTLSIDDEGVHVIYERVREPTAAEIDDLTTDLISRRERARQQPDGIPILDAYERGPSFWLGPRPLATYQAASHRPAETLRNLHRDLLILTREGPKLDFRERLFVFQGLRRALLRDSLLVRILPDRSELAEQNWGELLAERFLAPLPGQHESVADRLAVFAEDLQASAGNVYDASSPRRSIFEATRSRDGIVEMVRGDTDSSTRERRFAGFNSPLEPEILICTTVGQEGIDLHRHCRNVIHYDLAWNPAVIEQRTGRVDRIGSQTFRERAAAQLERDEAFLRVGVPFLAGTYDERMYEELRIRAQMFEVLTGGEVAADNLEGTDDHPKAEGEEEDLRFPVMPPEMIADLRVRLHVWDPKQ